MRTDIFTCASYKIRGNDFYCAYRSLLQVAHATPAPQDVPGVENLKVTLTGV